MLFIINVKLLYWNYWNWELNWELGTKLWKLDELSYCLILFYLSTQCLTILLTKELLIVLWPLTNGRTGGETVIW